MAHHSYNGAHTRIRRTKITELKAHHIATGVWLPCPRCGLPMAPDPLLPGEGLDLGHSDPARKQAGLPGDRLEHRGCNRSAGNETRTPPDWTSVQWL